MALVSTCLWFDGQAEEAANFYVSLLPDSRILSVSRTTVDTPGVKAGGALFVEFTLGGQSYSALNGGPMYAHTPAASIFVLCPDKAFLDTLWNALLDGGKPVRCGWLTDRYGLSWQIVPAGMTEFLKSPERDKAKRAMQAMMGMVKLDIDALRAAFEGTGA